MSSESPTNAYKHVMAKIATVDLLRSALVDANQRQVRGSSLVKIAEAIAAVEQEIQEDLDGLNQSTGETVELQ